MRSKYPFAARPKYTLWILVAVLVSSWYVIDPQARPQRTEPLKPTLNPAFSPAHLSTRTTQRQVS